MCFNQTGEFSTQNGSSLKLVDKFTYLGSSFSSTETNINTSLAKAWTANDSLSVIWKSDLTDKMKCTFFFKQRSCRYCCRDPLHGRKQNVWRTSLTATTQECCEQYWTSPGGSTPQSSNCTATYHLSRKLSKLEKTRYAGPCWRSRDELISDVLMWTPSQRQDDQLGLTYNSSVPILEGLPEAMDDREGCWERVREIRADGATGW